MLNRLLRRLAASLIAAGLAAGAAGVTMIAAGFALYAGLRPWLSAPAAGGVTALSFAVITLVVALIAPGVLKGRARKPADGLKLDPATLRMAAETVLTLLAAAAERRGRRAAKTEDKDDRKSRRK